MKRLMAMLLAVALICMPMVGLAEGFVFPETLDELIPNAVEVLAVAPPNIQPQLLMSEEKDVLVLIDVPEDEPSTIVHAAILVFDGEYYYFCDLEKSTEDEKIYVPVTPVDGERMMEDIKKGMFPSMEISCENNQVEYEWIYTFEIQNWERHVYGQSGEWNYEIVCQWDNELEPNYNVWVYKTVTDEAEYSPEGNLIK